MSRTGRVPQLYGHEQSRWMTMNPNDIARRGLTVGEVVRVASRRGLCSFWLAASDDIALRSQCYVPMHWGRLSLAASGSHGINALTVPVCDPVSKQPELKHAAAGGACGVTVVAGGVCLRRGRARSGGRDR